MSSLSSSTVNTGRPTLFETITVELKGTDLRTVPVYVNSGNMHGPQLVRVSQLLWCPSPAATSLAVGAPHLFSLGFDTKVPLLRTANGEETTTLSSKNCNFHTFPVSSFPWRLTNVTEFFIHDNRFNLVVDKCPLDEPCHVTITLEFLQEKFVKAP